MCFVSLTRHALYANFSGYQGAFEGCPRFGKEEYLFDERGRVDGITEYPSVEAFWERAHVNTFCNTPLMAISPSLHMTSGSWRA